MGGNDLYNENDLLIYIFWVHFAWAHMWRKALLPVFCLSFHTFSSFELEGEI